MSEWYVGNECGDYLQPDGSMGSLATARVFTTYREARAFRQDSLHVYGDYLPRLPPQPHDEYHGEERDPLRPIV